LKVTKEKAAQNREALIRAAGRLIRERGIDGTGVAEISKAAGLTHGALYAQFPSKDALAAEAFASAFHRGYARMLAAVMRDDGPSLAKYLDYMLSTRRRNDLAHGCPLTASASEIGRRNKAISARFSECFLLMVVAIEAVLGAASRGDRRQRALVIVAAEIGAIAVARAMVKSHPKLSGEVLVAMRRALQAVADAPKAPRKRVSTRRRSR